jgi:hypothetical protein
MRMAICDSGFVLRFLHASHAADIRALDCLFREAVVSDGWPPSLAGLRGRVFAGDGIFVAPVASF